MVLSPFSRHEKKDICQDELNHVNEGDFFISKKGQTYRRYSLDLKLEAVRLVNEEHMSIREVATRLDIQNKSQVQVWAAKAKQGMSLEPATSKRGRPRTKFSSMEEEMAYLRAEIKYLKKQYPNLHKE